MTTEMVTRPVENIGELFENPCLISDLYKKALGARSLHVLALCFALLDELQLETCYNLCPVWIERPEGTYHGWTYRDAHGPMIVVFPVLMFRPERGSRFRARSIVKDIWEDYLDVLPKATYKHRYLLRDEVRKFDKQFLLEVIQGKGLPETNLYLFLIDAFK